MQGKTPNPPLTPEGNRNGKGVAFLWRSQGKDATASRCSLLNLSANKIENFIC